jgi:protein-tyrosine phosphatase
MPLIQPGEYPGNIVADNYLKLRTSGASINAKPLYDSQGRPLLEHALDEIDAKWGSVKNYLDEVLGVDSADIKKIRSLYLE